MLKATHERCSKPSCRLGVVAFLNARPLIAGLEATAGVELLHAVPARLPRWLDGGKVDAALVPIVDVLRSAGHYRVLSDACIGCDGETMTVRVFSQVPPDRVQTLWADADSHTSVALARVLWRELYDRDLELHTLDTQRKNISELESVLLIGDKVVDPARAGFAYEVDLGGAWRQHTGLPFVFAVWATLERFSSICSGPRPRAAASSCIQKTATRGAGRYGLADLSALLCQARDQGVRTAAEIAAQHGPELGWPVELAQRYLTRCLKYKLDARSIAGVNLFAQLCAQFDIVSADAEIVWPKECMSDAAP